jgi:hypothetical protein
LLRPAAGRFAFLRKRYRHATGKNGDRAGIRSRPKISRRGSGFVVAATLAMRDVGA